MTASLSPETNSTDWARPLYARQITMLGELAESGLEVALFLKERIKTETETDPAALVMAYGRAARATRLTLMLQAQLIKALEDRDDHRENLSAFQVRQDRRDKQAQVTRIVERIADQEPNDHREVAHLVREAGERMEKDDIYDLMSHPVSELVAMICRDLNLDPDWPSRMQEAWALEEIRAGQPGWPLAASSKPAATAVIERLIHPSG